MSYGGSPLALVLRPCPFLTYNGNTSSQDNHQSVFSVVLVHIYNYAYSFGAGMRREIKGILFYLIVQRQTGTLDLTMFSLLLPVLGLPPGFIQNNVSASAGLEQAFTFDIHLHHKGRIQYCRVYIHLMNCMRRV